MADIREAWLQCREGIIKETGGSVPVAAVTDCILESYPGDVAEWVLSKQKSLLRDAVSHWEGDLRREYTSGPARFTEATHQLEESGDVDEFRQSTRARVSIFDVHPPYVDVTMGELRRGDIKAIRAGYQTGMKELALYDAVWGKIYKKIGLKKVSEVYTEDQLESMFHGLKVEVAS